MNSKVTIKFLTKCITNHLNLIHFDAILIELQNVRINELVKLMR